MPNPVAAETAWHVVGALLIFVLGAGICLSIATRIGLPRNRAAALYVWHSLFSLIYLWFALTYGADAIPYYIDASEGRAEFEVGTGSVTVLARAIILLTRTSLAGVFLSFNIFGAVGLLLLAAALREVTANSGPLPGTVARFLPFLPSASFWSSAIGKDSISFFAVCLMLWGCRRQRFDGRLVGAAIVVMALVRPHIAALMFTAVLLSTVQTRRISLLARSAYLVVGGGFVVYGLPIVLGYVGLADFDSLNDVSAFVNQRQLYNQSGNGQIDISQMSLPAQVLSYLFRPHPLEAHNLFALVASVEGVLIFGLMLAGVRSALRGTGDLPGCRALMWVYSCSTLLALATTTANLGISLRQKWMILPILFYLILSGLGTSGEPRTLPGEVQVNRVKSFAR